MWVKSEYAGELAVLSAWLCALLPWGISVASEGSVRLIRFHFLYLFVQFLTGSDFVPDTFVMVWEAPGYPANPETAFGYQLWLLAGVVLTVALALSVAYYHHDEELEERSPVDPVRAMGGLLVGAAIPLTATTYFLTVGFRGLTVPIGVVFMYVLGALLLVVERT